LVKLWSADRGEGRAVLRGHAGRVNGIAFTPDGRFLVTASQDKTLRVWELSRYEWSGTFTLPGPHIQLYENLAFSPDSRSVALPIGSNRIGIVEIAAQKIVAEYPGKNPAYSTERDRLAVLVSTNRIAIWDASKRELLRELDAGFPLAGPPVFNSDATILTARGSKGGVFVWHLGESPSARILNLTAPVSAGLFFGSNAHELAVVHANNGTIEWFDLESGRTRASLATGTAPVSCVSLSPDRSQVALGETGPRVRVHALRSGKTDILNGDDGSILSLAWSPDSRRLAVGSFEGSVKLWNVATRREVCTLRGNLSMLTALAFSSDGRHLVAGSVADDTRIWSTPLLIETENRP
jgi:WD40 repeat protein